MFKYNIKARREELGLSLQDVADIVGVNKSTVMKWENGQIEDMKRSKIALLAKALRITPLEFMGLEEPRHDTKLSASEQRFFNAYNRLKNSADPKDRAAAAAIERLLGLDEQESDDKQGSVDKPL